MRPDAMVCIVHVPCAHYLPQSDAATVTSPCRATACLINLSAHNPAILQQIGSQDRIMVLLRRISGATEADQLTQRTALLIGLMARDEGMKLDIESQEKVLAAVNAAPALPAEVDPTDADEEGELDIEYMDAALDAPGGDDGEDNAANASARTTEDAAGTSGA
jgi:hypothetical protein